MVNSRAFLRVLTVVEVVATVLFLAVGCVEKESETVDVGEGDPSMRGGSPTIRRSFERPLDDPYTTNDESNDQPVGHFGTVTLSVYSYESGNYYTLDGDVEQFTLSRLYFPKGGWVDFWDCELDEELYGSCWDEEGRSWEIEGESSGYSGSSDPESDFALEDEHWSDDSDSDPYDTNDPDR